MNIRELRKNSGMTQKQFAERFGIALSTLRRWEQRVSEPPSYLVPLMQQLLNIAEDIIIQGKNQEIYHYNKKGGILSDSLGNSVRVQIDLNDVKEENLKLYITDLFEEINEKKTTFERMCDEDKKSEIIWIER